MRCLYRERRWECGNYLEVDYYPVFAQPRKTLRKRKSKPTSEVQAKLNDRNARRELVRILHANFNESDIEIHLTYTDKSLPRTDEEAAKDIRNYIRRVRRLFADAGLPAPKYVYVTEGGGRKRYHHHLTISGGISRDALEDAWKGGRANARRLQFGEHGVEGLAHYITKQFRAEDAKEDGSPMKKHWIGSKNLIHPKPKDRDGVISRKRVVELATVDERNRAAFEQLHPGYFFAEQETLMNDVNGGIYLTVKMYRGKLDRRTGEVKRE